AGLALGEQALDEALGEQGLVTKEDEGRVAGARPPEVRARGLLIRPCFREGERHGAEGERDLHPAPPGRARPERFERPLPERFDERICAVEHEPMVTRTVCCVTPD